MSPDWYDEDVHTPNWLVILCVCLIGLGLYAWVLWWGFSKVMR